KRFQLSFYLFNLTLTARHTQRLHRTYNIDYWSMGFNTFLRNCR
ncbi:unnamed protein product, partial [Larinioides sclopetarius]